MQRVRQAVPWHCSLFAAGDVALLQVVLNFDAPRSLDTYVHRIGRTARAGAGGVAVSLIGDEDRALIKEVVKQGKVQLKQRLVPQQVRPVHQLYRNARLCG